MVGELGISEWDFLNAKLVSLSAKKSGEIVMNGFTEF